MLLYVVAQVKLQTIVRLTEAANMTDKKLFLNYFSSMSALGRNFKLGDLYNYHNDLILPGIKLTVTLYLIAFHVFIISLL